MTRLRRPVGGGSRRERLTALLSLVIRHLEEDVVFRTVHVPLTRSFVDRQQLGLIQRNLLLRTSLLHDILVFIHCTIDKQLF